MNQQIKVKRPVKMVQNTTDVYLQGKARNRYSLHYAQIPNRNDSETIRSITRKSIQNHPQTVSTNVNPYSKTIAQPQRHYYKRTGQNIRRQLGRRLEEQQQRVSLNKSPYLKRESAPGRSSSLNRSTHKIKSSSIVKQVSPHLYKQPRSSLSQHYDNEQADTYKRRASVIGEERQRNYILEEAKEMFKTSHYNKAIELLKKFTRIYAGHAEAKYFLGMSYINNNEFSMGIQELLETIKLQPKFKKNLYLVLALAYKKLGKFDEAIDILSKGLQYFPNFHDCVMYRGKMYMKLEQYQMARNDFTKSIQLNGVKGYAYVNKGTAEKQLGMIDEAIKTFTCGLNTDTKLQCYQKRGKCYFAKGNLEKALQDFEKCTEIDPNYSAVHYHKGMIYYTLKRYTEAILNFEECLKNDTDSRNLTQSVETMIKIKIQDKDFYEAYHILNRTQNIDVNRQVIDEWRIFLEATLFLIKKKSKQGIDNYKSLLNKQFFRKKYSQIVDQVERQRYRFIKPLIHLYKGYGELNEGHKSNAIKEYRLYEQSCEELDLSNFNLSKQFNSLIINAGDNFPENSLSYLQKANILLSIKPEPYLYLCFEKVANWPRTNKKVIMTSESVNQTVRFLCDGIELLPQLSNNHISTFYYFRAVMYLYNNEFSKAVPDIDKAIEKSEDNIPKYFYLRGLIFACFGNFTQAIQDLSVAISLDEKYAKPYLERAKCLQIEGNSNQAFLDLQKYITLAPEDQNIHKYAGFLLFQNCAYDDCLSAFSHGPGSDDPDILITKAKCNFLLGIHNKAIESFTKYQKLMCNEDLAIDIQLIQISNLLGQVQHTTPQKLQKFIPQIQIILKTYQEGSNRIFKLRDIYQLIASINILLGQTDDALDQLTNCLELFQKEKQKELEKQFVQDMEEFEDQWSQIEIKYNIALCYLYNKMPEKAKIILKEFEKSSEKGKHWDSLIELIDKLIKNENVGEIELITFEQSHRLSKEWPMMGIPDSEIKLSLSFSYPFVEPPEMIPEFDQDIFNEFSMLKSQNKPEAPWINRGEKGLIFTPNVQVFDHLQLSMTTTKQNQPELQSSQNQPISQAQHSLENSEADIYLDPQDLKKKFKLDSDIEIKLQRLMKKR